jgi:hypothetical protein
VRIKYPKAIQESKEELKNLEQSLRGQKTADRVRMLRLLKSGTVQSMKECAPKVGLQRDPADPAFGNALGQQASPGCFSSTRKPAWLRE